MQTIAKILFSILMVLIFQRFVAFMNLKEKQLGNGILLFDKLSNPTWIIQGCRFQNFV